MTKQPHPVTTARPVLIGLVSHAPRSGKSAIAEILEANHGFIREPFAGPLKELAIDVLISAGVTPYDAQDYVHKNKATIIPELGVTARHILQTLGTNWGRRQINGRLWLLCWENTYNIYVNSRSQSFGVDQVYSISQEQLTLDGVSFASGSRFLVRSQTQPGPLLVVVEDVRFPNEAETIRRLGGQLWEVVRPGTPRHYPLPDWLSWLSRLIPRRWRSRFHASEGRLRNYPHFNLRIVNDGTLEDLEATVDFLFQGKHHLFESPPRSGIHTSLMNRALSSPIFPKN